MKEEVKRKLFSLPSAEGSHKRSCTWIQTKAKQKHQQMYPQRCPLLSPSWLPAHHGAKCPGLELAGKTFTNPVKLLKGTLQMYHPVHSQENIGVSPNRFCSKSAAHEVSDRTMSSFKLRSVHISTFSDTLHTQCFSASFILWLLFHLLQNNS